MVELSQQGITDGATAEVPTRLRAEIVVIGSGCGGATVARTLARAGRDVLVLEEGGDYHGRRLDRPETERYDRLYMDRGGRMTSDLSISVLQGRVLGGSAVINACDVVPLRPQLVDYWQRRFGLSELTNDALAPHAAQALADLRASPIPEARLNRANQLLRLGTERLGLRGEIMQHNRVDCAGLGTCLIGCPVDAKQNPRTVFLPQAISAGAKVWTRARAARIRSPASGPKVIDVDLLDEPGYHVRARLEVHADIVVVAGNAVSSAELLLRSGLGNEHVGRNLILQPQLPIVAIFPERVEAFSGIPQAWAVTEHELPCDDEHGLWGYRIEAMMGTPGIVASLLPYVGVAGKEMMQLYPRLAASLLLVPDAPAGVVRVDGGRLRIDYAQADEQRQRLRQAAKTAARIYLAAGAERVIVPVLPPVEVRREAEVYRLDEIPLAPASAPLMSAHQQGTVRMSATAATGAVDQNGQLWGVPGVYVCDASLFPTTSSSHTMTPVLTVAGLLAARLSATLPTPPL